MKKIFFLLVTICTFFACDPVQEDISMGDHITAEQLKEMCTVTTDKDASGKNGNVISCTTSAPVSAAWKIAGKDLAGTNVKQKVRVGEYTVTLTAICGDGTKLNVDFPVNCEVETDEIKKFWIYGEDPVKQPEFWLESGDAGAGRFSDNEGKYFPYLDKETYFGHKTLVFEVTETEKGKFIWADPPGSGEDGLTVRIMNSWWNPTFADDVVPTKGYWELPITEDIAKSCAASADGGEGKDLCLLMTRGRIKIKACYYEY